MRSRIAISRKTAVASLGGVGRWAQSTATPSETAVAIWRRSCSSGLSTGHLLCEPNERAADCHLRGWDAGLAERRRDVRVRAVQFDAKDDRFAVGRLEARECGLVAFECFVPDRFLERRWVRSFFRGVQRLRRPMAAGTADFVADLVEERRAQVPVKPPRVPQFELPDVFEDLDERVLHKVVGVERATGPGRQPPVGPTLETGEVTSAQLVLRGEVAVVGAADEGVRRLGVQRALILLTRRHFGHFGEPTGRPVERAYHTLLDRRRRR